ncbi:MAG: carbohydrate ABC transporter permease [Chloroflexi bacterium]|nr:carbohydrate ABC transporter permease [Chloroflexota bacterium]
MTLREIFNPKRRRLYFLYLCSAILLFWALAPIYWVFVSSVSTRQELYARPYKIWFPAQPTFNHYVTLFTQGAAYRDGGFSPTAGLMGDGLRNSIVISIASATVVTFLATGAGYSFARLRFRGKQFAFFFLMLMMPLPFWVALIALFFLISQLNMLDTVHGLILLFIVFELPLSVWLMSTFIRDIPSEIEDAAMVDGCNRWQILFRIIIPLARPGMIAVFLVALLTTWNNFLLPLVFSRTSASQPMTVVLTLFIGQYEVAWEDMSAAAVVTMLPPFVMALFFQRYLVRGLTMGAVK